MKKLTFPFTPIWVAIILMRMILVQGMEDYMQLTTQKNYWLICNKVQLFEKKIKTFMKLRCVCKHYNQLLKPELIGNFCKNYSSDTKDLALRVLIQKISFPDTKFLDTKYKYNAPIVIILHTLKKVDEKNEESIYFLLKQAVYQNNISILRKLYELKANFNIGIFSQDNFYTKPLFFFAQTIDAVKFFINSQVYLQTLDQCRQNVLWHVIENNYSAKLVGFYLDQGVDARQLNGADDSCLLHAIAAWSMQENIENCVEQCNILLNAMPEMVNKLNDDGQSPLYLAHYHNAPQRIINMFTTYGGRVIPEYQSRHTKHDNCAIS